MVLRTVEEYHESLRRMDQTAYVLGEKITDVEAHPLIKGQIAGGLVADMPSEKDLCNPEIGHLVRKYLKGANGVTVDDRMRMYRLIEKLAFETRDIVSNIHGGGSPEAHRMTLLRDTDLEPKKAMARRLTGIGREGEG